MIPIPMATHLSRIYPTARIRGRFITRMPETNLGWSVLDAATADEMGRDHLGWFVGGHPGIARAAEQLGRLDANSEGGVWIVVPHSRDLAHELYDRWPHIDHVIQGPRPNNSAWQSRKVWVAIPEDLRKLLPPARALAVGIAGVIILDPSCIMYKARSGTDTWGKVHRNDRPQHVVNFRAALNTDGWLPPLLVLTMKPAMAVNTAIVARAFCLEAFRFVAGESFGCADVAIEPDLTHFGPPKPKLE